MQSKRGQSWVVCSMEMLQNVIAKYHEELRTD